MSHSPAHHPSDRPHNHEVENENLRPAGEGRPPRPATEKPGAKPQGAKTKVDPGSGAPH